MKKILLIHTIVTPTTTLLFNKMNDKFLNEWYKFKIIFTSETEWNRDWDVKREIRNFNFDYEILDWKQFHSKSKKDHHFFHLNFNINKVLNKEKPDIIIQAWWSWLAAFFSCKWSIKNNSKFVLWSWSTSYEKSWRRVLTKPLVKWLVKNSDSFLSYWTRASEYLEVLWADKYKIYKLYNTIDIDYFIDNYYKLVNDKRNLLRKFNIKTTNVLLYVWRLEVWKWIYNVLEWFIDYQKENKDITLLIVWWWNEENNLKNIVKAGWYKNIIFTWYIQKKDISELFIISNILVLPSYHEIWWLVINEAMCFNLPILTSNTVWASVDLVFEWKNGYIMKDNSRDEVKNWIKSIIEKDLINNNNSLEIIKKFTIDKNLKKLII